jgi:hypothetical protein
MKTDDLISRKEHKLLLITILLGFSIRILNLAAAIYFPEPAAKISFGLYSIFEMPDRMSPIYSFVVFFICFIMAWKIHLPGMIFSAFLVSALTHFYDSWFITTQRAVSATLEMNPDYDFKTFDFFLVGGSFYDFLTLFIINVLFVWQATILFRMMLRYFQRKSLA